MFPYVDDGGQPQVAWVYYQSKGIVTGEQFGSNQGCLSYEIQHCDHRITELIYKIPKLVTPLIEIYLDRILSYFSTSTLSDSIKINTLLNNLSDEVFDNIKSICSDTDILDLKIVTKKLTYLLPQNSSENFMQWYIRVSKLHKKCNFSDDSRLKEKLRTSTLNDKIKYGIKLDSINDKSDVDNISYMNNDKKSDKDKNFNNRNRNDNNNYFKPDNNFRNNYDNRNRDRNYNNNFRYNDRNYGNNNSRYHDNYNNYNYNIYRYNNNNQSNYGRNNTWHDNNQRRQIQYGDGNRNNYQSYNNNSNNYRGSDNNQRKQIQYNINSNNYRGSDNNNRKQIQYNNNDYNMNIEEIIEEKVDSTKNKDDR
ncbi:probable serine/threonine-protein kinase clkA [Gordionus sp. m RMFG-2023]|uniref:probable serine/threonine-protein kinase clkA n=1 Tax=Gordionus sp. m RMFG-2023 TaxID=3053472 RepID=UPI0031FD1677